jgi:hypothetical protein
MYLHIFIGEIDMGKSHETVLFCERECRLWVHLTVVLIGVAEMMP